ncbi:MAG: DUF2624 family protein [Bacilli bacterium]|nr:DUF2624 family protein [Bacilli bacterium]
MIFIYREIIKKYISQLRPNHIEEYAKKYNIFLTKEEISTLYSFIQKNYLALLEEDTCIFQLKSLIREDLFQKIYILYQENKKKYL